MDHVVLVSLLSLAGAGMLLGFAHAIEADHLAAVSTFIGRAGSLKRSSLLGFFWGLGHSSILILAGIILLLFRISIPDTFMYLFEMGVGVMLVVLGLRVIIQEKIHLHRHRHDGVEHLHLHSHAHSEQHHHYHGSFVVGVMHGLAGSGALLVFVLASTTTVLQGLGFLFLFGASSFVGMVLFSGLLGIPFFLVKDSRRWLSRMQKIAGCISVLIGMRIIFSLLA